MNSQPSKPKCLETRKRDGVTYRTYRKPNGRRVQTVEIPLTVFEHQRFRLQPEIDAWHRGEVTRDRMQVLKTLTQAGEKQEYIAAVLGVGQPAVAKAQRNARQRGAL